MGEGVVNHAYHTHSHYRSNSGHTRSYSLTHTHNSAQVAVTHPLEQRFRLRLLRGGTSGLVYWDAGDACCYPVPAL